MTWSRLLLRPIRHLRLPLAVAAAVLGSGSRAGNVALAQATSWNSGVAAGWSITSDAARKSCSGEADYQDGMKFWIGVVGPEKRLAFVFGKAGWADLQPNATYKIRFVFDGRKEWTGEVTGTRMADLPALVVDGVREGFFTDFMNYNELTLFHNNRRLGSFSLRGTSAVVTEIRKCHDVTLAGVAPAPGSSTLAAEVRPRTLACVGALGRDSDEHAVGMAFGAGNIQRLPVQIAPGQTETSTVVFANTPARRIEIHWRNNMAWRRPASIRLAEGSDWKVALADTDKVVGIGSSLEDIERANGRAVTLSAFNADEGGLATPVGWQGGKLSKVVGGCALYLQFRPSLQSPAGDIAEVSGTKEIQSTNAALRRVRPTVARLELFWPPEIGEERLQRLQKLLE